jgi:antitoxin CptB
MNPVGRWKATSTARASPAAPAAWRARADALQRGDFREQWIENVGPHDYLRPTPKPTALKAPPANCVGALWTANTRLKRLRFRAWHRGVKEADLLIGGFFDAHHAGWNDARSICSRTLEEQDVDIMAWAMGTPPVPDATRFDHAPA